MKLTERVELLKRVNEEGAKAYKTTVLTESDKNYFLELLSTKKLSRKESNFFKFVDSYIIESKKDTKKEEKKIDTTEGEQMLLNVLDIKEESQSEPKEEVKPVEKEEQKEEKKVANKKPLNAKEKKVIKLQEYKEEFYKELGDLEERKQINKFIRTEITNDDIDRYFDVSPLKIDKIGLQLLNNKAVFFLDTEYGMERVTIIDKDYKDNRLYVLIKSLDTKNFDRVYLDTYDSKKGVFVHHIDDNTIYDMTFYIPVLKEGVTIE